MNGRQIAEIAHQHRPDLKILFVTGYAEHATGHAPFLARGMEMVTKPFALDALALKIRDMLRKNSERYAAYLLALSPAHSASGPALA